MTKQIKHIYYYAHQPQVVWDYLTKSELMEQWLMKNDFEPVIGHNFTFVAKPMPEFDFDGIFHCKLLEMVPLKKLIYSWKSGPGGGKMTVDSIVEWTLRETEDGTELLLEHTGFKEVNLSMANAMDAGWLGNMKKIDKLISDSKNDAAKA